MGQNPLSLEIFPDVVITDIEGVNHRPYDHLNAGKKVIIDFFSTSCAPCWEYHENQVLQSIYETYGPEGSEEIVVYMVEGNLNTTIDDLAGSGSNTFGNFIDCSPYPIIDDHEFTFRMGIHEDPTLLFICPDKKVSEIGQLSETDIANLIEYNCPDQNYQNNLDLLYFTCNLDPTCGEVNFIPTVMVQNNGSNTIEHVSLLLKKNGEIIQDSVGFDLFIEQYETTELPFDFGEISSTTDIDISISTVNHQEDSIAEGNILIGTKPILSTNEEDIVVRITTDNFGYEIFWEILDESGEQVIAGGNELVVAGGQQDVYHLLDSPNHYSSATIYDIPVTLPQDGCYSFKIYDDWGDGICCQYGTGKFEIFNAAGQLLVDNENFLKDHSIDFVKNQYLVNSSELSEVSDKALLYPNPTKGFTTLSYFSSETELLKFDIYDSLGQLIKSEERQAIVGSNEFQFDFSNLRPGGYYLFNDQKVVNLRLPFQIF